MYLQPINLKVVHILVKNNNNINLVSNLRFVEDLPPYLLKNHIALQSYKYTYNLNIKFT